MRINTALSLDRTFSNATTRLNAIIADLNAGLIPRSRYPELLHENFFENDTQNGLGINSKTFIAYAIKELKDPYTFLFNLKLELGATQFNYYMQMPNYLQCGEELKSLTAYELYKQNKGSYNLEPLSTMQADVLRANTTTTAAIELAALEDLLNREIYASITREQLPLMHLDKTAGYESTLNYLTRIGHINLFPTLISILLEEWVTQPSAQRAVWFLSRSNLPDKYKHHKIFTVGDVSITLADVSTLDENELNILFSTPKEQLLKKCIKKNLNNLFALYFTKFGFIEKDLLTEYGHHNITPLFWAAQNSCHQVIKTFLEKDFPNKADILLIMGYNKSTLLHHYIDSANTELVTTILNTKDVDIRKLLDARNKYGETPLHASIKVGNILILTALLETKAADLNARDVDGNTPLHSLELTKKNEYIAKILLQYGASPSLSMLINNTFSSETNSQLRANYLYTSTAYKVAQTVSNAVTSGLDAIRLRVTISHEISL